MNEELIAYLRTNIDDEIIIERFNEKNSLKLYIRELFDLYKTNILDNKVIIIEPKRSDITLSKLEKHINIIADELQSKIVVLVKRLSDYQRKTLIKKRIAFIESNKQMYLPFVALDIHEKKNFIKAKHITKFSTSAQVTYLYLLYNDVEMTIKQLAKILNRTEMTAQRALDELHTLDLIKYTIKGETKRKKIFRRIKNGKYYKIGQEYLTNPVIEKINFHETSNTYGALLSGLSALADKSMLSEAKYRCYSVNKALAKIIRQERINNKENDYFYREINIQFEVWKYDPKILSKNNIVDIVSLKLSLGLEKDERINLEIDKLLKEETWYMD